MPAPTKAYVAKLRAKLDAIRADIYACSTDTRLTLFDCIELAPQPLRGRYLTALEAVIAAEAAAVRSGRARYVDYGSIVWNK